MRVVLEAEKHPFPVAKQLRSAIALWQVMADRQRSLSSSNCVDARQMKADAMANSTIISAMSRGLNLRSSQMSFPESMARVLPLKHWHYYIS